MAESLLAAVVLDSKTRYLSQNPSFGEIWCEDERKTEEYCTETILKHAFHNNFHQSRIECMVSVMSGCYKIFGNNKESSHFIGRFSETSFDSL